MPDTTTDPEKAKDKAADSLRASQMRALRAERELESKGPTSADIREANAADWVENRMPFSDPDWDAIRDSEKAGTPLSVETILKALDYIWCFPTELHRLGMNHSGYSDTPGPVEDACRASQVCFARARSVLVYTARSLDPGLAARLEIGMKTLYGIYAPQKYYKGTTSGLLFPMNRWADNLEGERFEKLNTTQHERLVRLHEAMTQLHNTPPDALRNTPLGTLRKGDEPDRVSKEEVKLAAKSVVLPTKRKAVTLKEAAKIFEVSIPTIRNWEAGRYRPEGWPGRGNMLNLLQFKTPYDNMKKVKKGLARATRYGDIDKVSHKVKRNEEEDGDERYR